jgi:hypothetical protein
MQTEQSQFEKPFLMEHARLDEKANSFSPAARLHLTAHARTRGFIRVLSGHQARVMLVLMSSLTTNGSTAVTPTQVARALGIPTPVAAVWLRQLSHTRFDGNPIVERLSFESGLTVYTLSASHIHHVNHPAKEDPPVIQLAAGRDRVLAHVRSRYAVRKSDAVKEVMTQLGLHPEELTEQADADVWRELRYLRIRRDDIKSLIATFGPERIRRQLHWLPQRRAKSRSRTLVTSLMENWGPPKNLSDVLAAGNFAPHDIDDDADNSLVTEKGDDE